MANIKVFARLKPSQNNRGWTKCEDQTLFICGQACTKTFVGECHSSRCLRFGFAHVFDMDSSQDSVFDIVAKDIVIAFLEGYNGTILAFGQRKSGKTFTVNGGGNCTGRCDDSGIIQRSLSSVLKKAALAENEIVNIQVSFMEIYKETAYDLLGPLLLMGKRGKILPKVLVTLGSSGSCHLHGLSSHFITSEEEATRLYTLGVANRRIAQNSFNRGVSSSHTIFTILMSRQKHDSDIITRSKLHIVELAGSERLWKTSVKDQCQTEARFINLSLHHLELVVIAHQRLGLQSLRNHSKKKHVEKVAQHSAGGTLRRSRSMDLVNSPRMNVRQMSMSTLELRKTAHVTVMPDPEVSNIPYRNSLLTMVLQDSLGGNCNTAMIATLSMEEKDLHETIATCRFAQRVARIVNKPVRNEEVDKNAAIKRLQIKLAELHWELTAYKAAEQDSYHYGSSTDESCDKQTCANVMECFLSGRIYDPVAHGINTPRRFRTSLRYLRQKIRETQAQGRGRRDETVESADDQDSGVRTNSEPTSPLTSEGESDGILAANFLGTSPVISAASSEHRGSLTQDRVNLLTSDQNESKERPNEPFTELLQDRQQQETGKIEASTQTELLSRLEDSPCGTSNAFSNVSSASPERETPDAGSMKNFLVWEIELEKEALLNKSKLLASRLADQRARLVLMSRQGAFPEETEKEKIVELQLLKKQKEVEQRLFSVIKKLAEWKDASRLQQSQEKQQKTGNRGQLPKTGATGSSQIMRTPPKPETAAQIARELQLREQSTRQKLLSCRELMKTYSLSTSKPHVVPTQSALLTSSCRFGTSQTGLSFTSSVNLSRKDEVAELSGQRRQTSANTSTSFPSLNSRQFITRSRPGSTSCQKSESYPKAQSSRSTRRTLHPLNINRDRALKGNRNCHLIEYINNCHKTVYRRSTLPRFIEDKVFSDSRENGLPLTPAIQKPHSSEKARRHSSELTSIARGINLTFVPSMNAAFTVTNHTESMHEQISESHAKRYQDSNSQECENASFSSCSVRHAQLLTGSEQQTLSSLFHLKREQRERVKKIRQYVYAAELIQRTWRRYKRRREHEGNH